MVSVIGSAILFVIVVALCSMTFSRYVNSRRHRQLRRASISANDDLHLVSSQSPEGASPADNIPTIAQAVAQDPQLSLSAVNTPQKPMTTPNTKKVCMHRRSPHLISYTNDSDVEDEVRAASGFRWKQLLLPARQIAFRRRDSESAAGEGHKLDSLSVSPSRPIVFGDGEEKDGADRVSMRVVLTPPSPEVWTPLREEDTSAIEEVEVIIENEVT
ncbi:hypothetical protein D9619_005589 [Psilocybe cf. subviscida]|uniref:Uncharacterized protein n=1 Tax=Psilocybe cf. subviscida TaxID=2480587 RepID=A0A8H5FBR5_9AGAR|nr:hypothetical protein D9619_005589 [Psilocybe cf. subviscida]